MAGEYDINLSNGNVLATLYPLETNGPDNVSTPRIIQEARPAYNVVLAVPGGPSFSIVGDFTDVFRAGFLFEVVGSTTNNGTYTVVSSSFGGGNTSITVVEAVPGSGGNLGSIIAHIFRLNGDLTYRFAGSPVTVTTIDVSNSAVGSPAINIDGTYTITSIGAAFDGTHTIIPVTHGSIRDNVLAPIGVPYGDLTYSISDANSSIKLPGKGTMNYGESIIENLVRMVENFAADDAPDLNAILGTSPAADPLIGQLWYNTTPGSEGFKHWDGTAWASNVSVGDGSIVFVDIENTAGSPAVVAKMYIAASESNLPAPWVGGSPNNQPGMVIWNETDPVNGKPIFRVLHSDGSEALRVDHNGNTSTLNNLIAKGTGESFIYGSLGIGTAAMPVGSPAAIIPTLFVNGLIDAPVSYTDLINSDTNIPNVEYVEAPMRAMSEPTGIENRVDSVISFDDGTLTFTLTSVGSPFIPFYYWIDGAKYIISAPVTKTIADVEGMHYLYIDTDGVIQDVLIFNPDTLLKDNAYLCAIYWDATNNKGIYVADERHGITMDHATHTHFHLTQGTQYVSGLALSSLTVNGDGSAAAHAQFGVENGVIRDEDLHHNIVDDGTPSPNTYDLIQALLSPAEIPVFYRTGSGTIWRAKTANTYPLIYDGEEGFSGTGRAPYNQFTGGSWTLTEVTDNDYFLMHYLATNDINNPIVGIQGQNEYADVTAARDGANSELSGLSGLPFEEFTPIATVIFQTSSSFTNVPQSAVISVDAGSPILEEYVDWRDINTFTSVIGGGGITDHSNLSGLTHDDHLQYLLVDGTRAMSSDLTLANSTPTADLHAASKLYVDNETGAKSWREPVRVRDAAVYASNAAFPVTGIIDGVALNDQDRVLFTNVTVQADNDVWIYNAGSPSTWTKIISPNNRTVGDVVSVDEGSYARSAYIYSDTGEWHVFGSGAGVNVRYEAFTVAGSPAETTVYNLAEPYSVGTNRLQVFVDGVKQTLTDQGSPTTSDYEETDSLTVTFNNPITAGSLVEFYAYDEVTPNAVISKRETQTGLTGTPVINFTTLTYLVGGSNLFVFLNGQKMLVGIDYTETTSSSITWINPTLVVTDALEFYSSVPVTAGTKLADVDNVTSNVPNNGDVLVYNSATGTWDVQTSIVSKPGYVEYLSQVGTGSPVTVTFVTPTGTGTPSNVSGGTASIEVFVNGVYQIETLNYTVGTGEITLLSPPASFDLVIYEFA